MARSIFMGSMLLLAAVSIAVWTNRGAVPTRLNDSERLDPSQVTQVQQRLPPSFDLRDLSIPAAEIRGGGPPKDGIPAITSPQTVAAAAARFLKASDRVVGVALNGQARAYPISILTQHEIVNGSLQCHRTRACRSKNVLSPSGTEWIRSSFLRPASEESQGRLRSSSMASRLRLRMTHPPIRLA